MVQITDKKKHIFTENTSLSVFVLPGFWSSFLFCCGARYVISAPASFYYYFPMANTVLRLHSDSHFFSFVDPEWVISDPDPATIFQSFINVNNLHLQWQFWIQTKESQLPVPEASVKGVSTCPMYPGNEGLGGGGWGGGEGLDSWGKYAPAGLKITPCRWVNR